MFNGPNGEVMVHDFFTGETSTLLTQQEQPLLAVSFIQQLSADQEFLLIGYEYQKVQKPPD